MSNVTLTIGGRSYTVACAEGEETHVLGLGAMIDGKLSEMGDMSGQSESRMLLFAALLLADEAHESARKPAAPSPEEDPSIAQRISSIAGKLENLAARLES